MTISKQECMNYIVERIPGFAESWRLHLTDWGGHSAGLCNDMAAFSRYTADLILHSDDRQLVPIFQLIEDLVVEGDNDVSDAATTCFLENLQNMSSAGRIPALGFVRFLGPASRAYCQAWDDFTGTHTEGL